MQKMVEMTGKRLADEKVGPMASKKVDLKDLMG